MQINGKRALGALAVAALAVSLTACSSNSSGGSSNDNANITIAGVYGNTFDPFFSSLGCGAAAEAKTLGVKYKDFSATGSDTATFDQLFNSAKLTSPNGMFVNPLNPDQFVTQYGDLMKAGVPVVTINGSTPTAQYKIVGTDTTDLSYLSGLSALVPSGAGKIAVVNGVPGLVPVDLRLNPVIDAVKAANSQLTALDPVYSMFDVNKANSETAAIIAANPDLKVIVAGTGPDGAGVAAAVKAAGLSGKITVIALDATPDEVSALKDGTITALAAQSPIQIGQQQVKTLVDYLNANKTPAPITASSDKVGVPQKLLTAKNVGDSANADWVYQAKCSA